MLHIEQGHEVTSGDNFVEVAGVSDPRARQLIAEETLRITGRKNTPDGFAAYYWHNLSYVMVFRLSPGSPVGIDALKDAVTQAAAKYLGAN